MVLSRVSPSRASHGSVLKKPLVQSPRLWQVSSVHGAWDAGFFTAPHAHGSVLCCLRRACTVPPQRTVAIAYPAAAGPASRW